MAGAHTMTDATRPAAPRLRRSARVPTPGARARIDYVSGDLINVSATGALIRAGRTLDVGTEWAVTLDLELRRISLSGRVVRCDPVTVELPGGAVLKRAAFSLGVVFTTVSSDAMQSIIQLCGGTLTVEELPHRVLVVDDDPVLAGSITQLLTERGYQVRSVSDARQVLVAAKASRADAVLIHLSKVRESSMWWALETLQSDPATASIPVVVLTGPQLVEGDHARYLGERNVRIVTTPSADALNSAVEEALQPRAR